MSLFGVGAAEAGLILVIAMVLIGPQRFPEIMRQGGRWYRVARRFTDDVMKDVRAAVDEIEKEVNAETEDLRSVRELTDIRPDLEAVRKDTEAIGKSAADAAQTPAAQPSAPVPPGGTPGPPKPAETEPVPPSGTDQPGVAAYERRDPSTYDPFKALEARQRAAGREKDETGT